MSDDLEITMIGLQDICTPLNRLRQLRPDVVQRTGRIYGPSKGRTVGPPDHRSPTIHNGVELDELDHQEHLGVSSMRYGKKADPAVPAACLQVSNIATHADQPNAADRPAQAQQSNAFEGCQRMLLSMRCGSVHLHGFFVSGANALPQAYAERFMLELEKIGIHPLIPLVLQTPITTGDGVIIEGLKACGCVGVQPPIAKNGLKIWIFGLQVDDPMNRAIMKLH